MLNSSKFSQRISPFLNRCCFFQFCEKDKDYDNYIHNYRGPSIIFTRYVRIWKTRIRESNFYAESIVRILASQLYRFSMTKEMPTGTYTKWEYNEGTLNFDTKRKWVSYFEEQVTQIFQQSLACCEIQTKFTYNQ